MKEDNKMLDFSKMTVDEILRHNIAKKGKANILWKENQTLKNMYCELSGENKKLKQQHHIDRIAIALMMVFIIILLH